MLKYIFNFESSPNIDTLNGLQSVEKVKNQKVELSQCILWPNMGVHVEVETIILLSCGTFFHVYSLITQWRNHNVLSNVCSSQQALSTSVL